MAAAPGPFAGETVVEASAAGGRAAATVIVFAYGKEAALPPSRTKMWNLPALA
jgi:hypothetical protein